MVIVSTGYEFVTFTTELQGRRGGKPVTEDVLPTLGSDKAPAEPCLGARWLSALSPRLAPACWHLRESSPSSPHLTSTHTAVGKRAAPSSRQTQPGAVPGSSDLALLHHHKSLICTHGNYPS